MGEEAGLPCHPSPRGEGEEAGCTSVELVAAREGPDPVLAATGEVLLGAQTARSERSGTQGGVAAEEGQDWAGFQTMMVCRLVAGEAEEGPHPELAASAGEAWQRLPLEGTWGPGRWQHPQIQMKAYCSPCVLKD